MHRSTVLATPAFYFHSLQLLLVSCQLHTGLADEMVHFIDDLLLAEHFIPELRNYLVICFGSFNDISEIAFHAIFALASHVMGLQDILPLCQQSF